MLVVDDVIGLFVVEVLLIDAIVELGKNPPSSTLCAVVKKSVNGLAKINLIL